MHTVGRLTERQQLALALEESRKDSLPQQPEQVRSCSAWFLNTSQAEANLFTMQLWSLADISRQAQQTGSPQLTAFTPFDISSSRWTDVQEPDGSPEPSESGDQSSSLRCCEDEATTQPKGSSSSKQRSKQQLQQQGRRPSCQPCSPCRTQSHEQASTSGQALSRQSCIAAAPGSSAA